MPSPQGASGKPFGPNSGSTPGKYSVSWGSLDALYIIDINVSPVAVSIGHCSGQDSGISLKAIPIFASVSTYPAS